MWEKIIELAASNGIWTLLFCALLIFELKDSRSRQLKYQKTISSLTGDLGYLNALDANVCKLREEMRKTLDSGAVKAAKENI